ncbi:MAG: hypothetical protein MUC52_00990 [Candidatus Omnitrophica bacterium]|nr:hypothetical protein [Candidatus Omnitrophota bacterium]
MSITRLIIVTVFFVACLPRAGFAQLGSQLSSMGKSVVAQGAAVLSDALKTQLKDLAAKILSNQPKDSIISQWTQIIANNKNINVDAALGFLKQAIMPGSQSTTELLQTLKTVAGQVLQAPAGK